MIHIITYLLSLVALFAIAIVLCAYLVTGVYSTLKGSPFVPTSNRQLKIIFNIIKIKKDDRFIELGSGDGRVVRYVAKTFHAKATGIEINPLLCWFSIFLTKIQHLSKVNYERTNFYDVDMSKADIIYLFLLPNTIKKLSPKFVSECKKGCILISHGFAIHELENKKFHVINAKPFNTFFYRI